MLCIAVGHLYYDVMCCAPSLLCCALLYCVCEYSAASACCCIERERYAAPPDSSRVCMWTLENLHIWRSLLLTLHELPSVAVLLPPHSFATESDQKFGLVRITCDSQAILHARLPHTYHACCSIECNKPS